MNPDCISQNLAAVEGHFHSEAQNEVETALKLYTDDIVWDAPALNGLNRSFSGKEAVAENYRRLWAAMSNDLTLTTGHGAEPATQGEYCVVLGDSRDNPRFVEPLSSRMRRPSRTMSRWSRWSLLLPSMRMVRSDSRSSGITTSSIFHSSRINASRCSPATRSRR